MGIVDDDIARVREASDIVAIVSQHTALRRVGRRYQGLCPFHAEKTPSFSVNAEEGLYHCFGCGASGDVITFVRETEHLDFVGAVELLAGKAGVTLRYTDKAEGESRKQRERLVDAMRKAVAWYHERLLHGDDAAGARKYLRSRSYDGDVVREYQLGWAPDGWDSLARALRIPDKQFVDAGLGFVNSRGRLTDSFRGRVLFPIFDVGGDPVAFGGRVLPGGEGSKYKNSSETRIYAKSKVLYGLNWMKPGIVEADEAIVCEGYTDVIGFATAGMRRAVATCGTALTEEHVRVLKRFASRVVLAFDADSAGQAAADRFYEWERAYDIEVAVADLPGGVDPDDLAREDPDELVRAVREARPFLGFRVARVLDQAAMSSPERRARAAHDAVAVIVEHPDPMVRDQYLMQVADRCGVDVERLRQRAAEPRPLGDAPRGRVELSATRAPVRNSPEAEALLLAIHRPAEAAPLLDEVLFADELHAAAFRALASAQTLHEAIERADPAAADLLQQLAVEDSEAEALDVASRLADNVVAVELSRLDAEMRHSEEAFKEKAREHTETKLNQERLRDPDTAAGALEELVGWLRDRAEER
jgi:DNA primase